MSRINPLHIIALLFVMILFIFFLLADIKEEVQEEKESYKKSQQIAKELFSYKKLYGDTKRIQASLKRILSQSSLRKAKLKIVKKKESTLITSPSISLYALNSLLSKIFNGPYRIKTLDIKRIDKTHARLKLEIEW